MSMIVTEKHCFYPDGFEYLTPERWGLEYEAFRIPGAQGAELSAWRIHPPENQPSLGRTVVHLHGNAQNMTAHLLGSYFLALKGFTLITFDYRGYGRSPGSPSLNGIIEDGRAVIEHLLTNDPEAQQPLFLFGQSMGAFVTAHLLPDFPSLGGAVLEAGLISFRSLFLEAYPMAEVRVPEGYSTLEPLSRAEVRKLFIHGTGDQVVPAGHSERMHEAAAPPKEIMILDGVGHITALESGHAEAYVRRVVDFFSRG